MSEPRRDSRTSRKRLWLWASLAAILACGFGIEILFLLRVWQRRASIWTQPNATSNTVAAAESPTTDNRIEPTITPADDSPPVRPTRVPNDNFVNRFELATPAHVTAANTGASNEPRERIQNTQVGLVRWGDTLWWKWTAPASAPVTLDTLGSSFDTYLVVYTGNALSALTVMAENDNASEVGVGESLVSFNAQEGTEYQIQVGGVFTGGGRGSIPTRGNLQLSLVMAPSTKITAPLDGSIFESNIVLTVTSVSTAGPITNVCLYRGEMVLGAATQTPANFVLSNAPVGTNSFFAVATDDLGQRGTSAVVNVLVARRGITTTAPADGSVFFNITPITFSTFPLLPAGSITNVSFSVDGRVIGQTTAPPFAMAWTSVTSGPHQLTAAAVGDSGRVFHATPVHIAVAYTLFPTGSVWRYLDDGTDPGTKWRDAAFDDSSWKRGRAELGYGDGDEATRLEDNDRPGFNRQDTEHYITTYFRRNFVVTNIASYASLLMNVKRDDGAVVYLNGREAARFNMNAGAIDFLTLARNAGDDGKRFVPATVPASWLEEGTNVVAVEIHQATADSTDTSFEMALSAIPILKGRGPAASR